MDKSSDLLIIGEQAEWLANHNGMPLLSLLSEITSCEIKLRDAFLKYQYLSDTGKLAAFDKDNGVTRSREKDHLLPGQDIEEFKAWLLSLNSKLLNIHFVSKEQYSRYLAEAMKHRYYVQI